MMHSKWDMDMGSWVPVLLGKTEIDDVELIVMRVRTHQKICGFNVMVNEMGRVDALYA